MTYEFVLTARNGRDLVDITTQSNDENLKDDLIVGMLFEAQEILGLEVESWKLVRLESNGEIEITLIREGDID
ncbi:MAG: hypothetical protein ACO20X_00170 [Alphaproteobacteria bacterium]|jgi:hypothetical protein